MEKYFKKRLKYIRTHPNRWVRQGVGVTLVIGGLLGALPVLGFWMLPLGLLILSVDFRWARRAYLNLAVWWRRSVRPHLPGRKKPPVDPDT